MKDDTAAPLVVQVTNSPSDGLLAIGETVVVSVLFSSEVFVTGSPVLNLANGGVAAYASGSGTTNLNFAYVVDPSNTNTSDLSTASTNAIALPAGATILNLLGTAAVLSGANSVNPAGILAVDTMPPVVTSMAVNGNTVILSFSEAVKGVSLIPANFSRQIGASAAVFASAISLDSLGNKVTLTFTGTAPASNSAVKVTYAAISGNATSGLITDQAGNPLTVFSNKVVETYQSAITVSTLGDGGIILPATSFTNLALTGTSAINGTGNALANSITGNSGFNVLDGRAAVDLIDGLGSADIYLVATPTDHGAAEFKDSGASGSDEVRFSSVTAGQTLTLFAGDTGLETAVIGTGTALAAVTTGTTALNIDASALANGLTITGNAGANGLKGTAFADILIGNAGVDLLDGSGAADLYLVVTSADHGAAEFTDTGLTGTDEVRFTSATAGQTLTLYAGDTGLETAVIGTGTALAAVTTGTTALSIDATALANGLTITGNAGANGLKGTAFADILIGNAGVDLLDGSGAADLYLVVTSADHGAAEFTDTGLTGTDEVRFTSATAGQTLTLYAGDTGLETAVIGTGTAQAAVTTGTTALNIDATALANGLTITGNAGANGLKGTAFADSINGNAGIDTITGLAGADAIAGGSGLDVLSGGADGDRFIYTSLTDGLVGGTSTARTFETITDFQVGLDSVDAPGTTVRNVKVLGAVTALTDTAIGALLNASSGGSANFAGDGASIFSFGTRTFLAINNSVATYSATADAIAEITGFSYSNGATGLSNITIS